MRPRRAAIAALAGLALTLVPASLALGGASTAVDQDSEPEVFLKVGNHHHFLMSDSYSHWVSYDPGPPKLCAVGEFSVTPGPAFPYPIRAYVRSRQRIAVVTQRSQRPSRVVIRDWRRVDRQFTPAGKSKQPRVTLKANRKRGRVVSWRAIAKIKGRGYHFLLARMRWPTRGVCASSGPRLLVETASFRLGAPPPGLG